MNISHVDSSVMATEHRKKTVRVCITNDGNCECLRILNVNGHYSMPI